MIDAYEIGIQLALQDDVSAGLEVISRGLAEVDRAIDATSAKLVNLTAAEAAAGVAVSGVVTRPTAASDRKAQDSPQQPETEAVSPGRGEVSFPVSSPPSAAPAFTQIEVTDSGKQPSAAPGVASEGSKAASRTPSGKSMLPSAAPSAVQTGGPTTVHLKYSTESVAPGSEMPSLALPDGANGHASAAIGNPVRLPAVSKPRSVAPDKEGAVPAREERVFTSSISHTIAPSIADRMDGSPVATQASAGEPSAQSAGRAAAPWSGVDSRALSLRPEAASETAAAPQARQQDRSEGQTGTVMLDGHLVGYWLAEQMAKEASRPPSGTSFFDPRQTPAWTASGSL